MRSRGFTLVELIATMVILGIISVMTSKFIVNGFSFYVDATNIQKISTTANFVAEKMEKLIKNAVPNSIVIAGDGRGITFAPIKWALGYTYIPKNSSEAFDSNPTFYAIKPLYNAEFIKKNSYVAFNNYGSNEDYFKVTDVDFDGNKAVIKVDAAGKRFVPGSERGRMYFVGEKNRFVTIKFENKFENSKLVYIEHDGDESKGIKSIFADSLNDINFSRVAGAFNQYGEIQIEYSFPYDSIDASKIIYQRIGVANAP